MRLWFSIITSRTWEPSRINLDIDGCSFGKYKRVAYEAVYHNHLIDSSKTQNAAQGKISSIYFFTMRCYSACLRLVDRPRLRRPGDSIRQLRRSHKKENW